MAVSNIVSKDLAAKLSELSLGDFKALTQAGSLGLTPDDLCEHVHAINSGGNPEFPRGVGRPKPIKVLAWSFVNDRAQYHDTYGLETTRAAELKDMLLAETDKGVAEITRVVTEVVRRRGSTKPVAVLTTGLPGTPGTGAGVSQAGGVGRGALKDQIRQKPAQYGLYSFTAEDTGRTGSTRFRCGLGGGFYSTHPSKQGAVDIAKIARVEGRDFPLIADRVAFWLDGSKPLFGDDIPTKAVFSCQLPPHEPAPADPVIAPKTVAPAPRPETPSSQRSKPPQQ